MTENIPSPVIAKRVFFLGSERGEDGTYTTMMFFSFVTFYLVYRVFSYKSREDSRLDKDMVLTLLVLWMGIG